MAFEESVDNFENTSRGGAYENPGEWYSWPLDAVNNESTEEINPSTSTRVTQKGRNRGAGHHQVHALKTDVLYSAHRVTIRISIYFFDLQYGTDHHFKQGFALQQSIS